MTNDVETALSQENISKVYKGFLKRIHHLNIHFPYTDYTHKPIVITPDYMKYIWFYQTFIAHYGYEAVERATDNFESKKFAQKIKDLLPECHRYEDVMRLEMRNNIRSVYGDDPRFDVTDYAPLVYGEILRYIDDFQCALNVKNLTSIVSQFLIWNDTDDYSDFWLLLKYRLQDKLGDIPGTKLYKDILREGKAWGNNFGEEFFITKSPDPLPKKEDLSNEEYQFLCFLRRIKATECFSILHCYIDGSDDAIFKGVTEYGDIPKLSALLLAFMSSKLQPSDYSKLFTYSERLQSTCNGAHILNTTNRLCKELGIALIPSFKAKVIAPQNGEYVVPWEDVTFSNFVVKISNIKVEGKDEPISYSYRDIHSERTFGWLLYFFKMKVAPIILTFKGGEIVDGQFPVISDYVNHIGSFTRLVDIELSNCIVDEKIPVKPKARITRIHYSDFRKIISEGKNIYMDKLCKLLIDSDVVLKFDELNKHSYSSSMESGFAFCIAESSCRYTYAFENYLDARSTLLFKVSKDNCDEDLEGISSFLMSSNNNKRLHMQRGYDITINGKHITYGRAEHDDDWDNSIQRFIFLN